MKKLVYFLILLSCPLLSEEFNIENGLKEAYAAYNKGLASDEAQEKDRYFNQTLAIYMQIDQEKSDDIDLGKLYYNIGNTFYQLNNFPWAVLYYSKALLTDPRNERVLGNLKKARNMLRIPSQQPISYLFYPVTISLFFIFFIFAIVLISLFIWTKEAIWMKLSLTPLILSVLLLFSGIYQSLFDPVEAITVKPGLIFRSPSFESFLAIETPLPPGIRVRILNATDDGKWIKIATDEGEIGFVYYEVIRSVCK